MWVDKGAEGTPDGTLGQTNQVTAFSPSMSLT